MLKQLFVLLVITSLATKNSYAQKPVVIKLPLHSVKVGLNSAELKHIQKINLKPGKSKIVFTGLSNSITKNSLRLQNIGSAELLSLNLLKIDENSSLGTWENQLMSILGKTGDSLEYFEKNIKKTTYELEALELEKKMLTENHDIIPNSKTISLSELKTTTEYYRTRYTEIRIECDSKVIKLKELKRKRNSLLLTHFKSEIQENESSEFCIVMAEFNNPGSEFNTELELSYTAMGSGWIPMYDIFSTNNKDIKIHYRVKILNNTGIDWVNMKITISTADPDAYYKAPDLEPYYVSRYSSYRGNNSNNAQDQQQTYNTNEEEIYIPEREISFTLPKTYTLNAGLIPFFAEVTTYDLTPEFLYRTAPKDDEQVYVIARVTDWEKLNLIDGEAFIYNNGTYLGKSYIKPSSVEDALELPIGVLSDIFVKHKLINEHSNKRAFSGGITASLQYEIKLKNNGAEKRTIEVLDQVPVSESSSIKTDLSELADGGEKDPITGKIRWIIDLNAGSEKTLSLKYTVSYPRGYSYGKKYAYRSVRAKF